MNRIFNSIILLSVFLIGCDLAKPQGRKEEPVNAPTGELVNHLTGETISGNENPPPTETPPQDQTSTETEPPNKIETDSQNTEPENSVSKESTPQESDAELVKADVGAGKKGHYGQTDGEQVSDIITVPIATMFRAKEMTAYRIQVPQALQLYKAMNDNKGPETHEAFMKDIIKANNIPLPELPAGQEYIYDPATEQLMIRKPK
ncbi:MAG: MSCRAMM family adhesin SdrC [Planctomycetaceae bacterium]|jgi:hypothetical protein|nr:MSCRAMM family adhesin SdrC [Planctomycetaceae bacterium]